MNQKEGESNICKATFLTIKGSYLCINFGVFRWPFFICGVNSRPIINARVFLEKKGRVRKNIT